MTCATKNCERIPERNGYCATCNRSRRKAAAPKAKPARKRIAKQSEEGKERMNVYLAIRSVYLAINSRCMAHVYCFPTLPVLEATDIHHKKGRDGDLLFDVRYWLPVCRACHKVITEQSEWAYNSGLSLSRHQTETI